MLVLFGHRAKRMNRISPFDLNGRVAIATGASRGIGPEVVEALARAGRALTISARSLGTLDESAASIGKYGRRCVSVA
jgi:short-subunit dehydrogenase